MAVATLSIPVAQPAKAVARLRVETLNVPEAHLLQDKAAARVPQQAQ